MKKTIIHNLVFVFFLTTIACNAQAAALFERSFAEMGYADFAVEGAQQRGCTAVRFLLPTDVNAADAAIYPILSLGIDFRPVQKGPADINVHFNGHNIAELTVGNFKCQDSICWERLNIPKEKLGAHGENKLGICISTSSSITKAVILSDSSVGLYKTADFSKPGAFAVNAGKWDLVIGEKTKITVLIHNTGSAAAFAEVRHARALAEDKNAFFVVEGKTSFKGFVNAGEQAEFSYIIKPRVLGSITLPPAILYYRNEFGEEEALFGNLVHLAVRQPERKIEAFIVKEREAGLVGEAIELQLAVLNIGSDPLFDLAVEVQLPDGINFVQQPQNVIAALYPNETELLPFSVNSSKEGRFAIGCNVTYTDVNLTESKCEGSGVEFEQPEISSMVYAGIALLVIALLVYFYIMHGK